MKIILATDSFKGTLTAKEVCDTLSGVLQSDTIQCVSIPIADGGEGTLAAIRQSIVAETVTITVLDALKRPRSVNYLVTDNGATAIIESAEAIGLSVVGAIKNPMETTTYGVGEIVKHAMDGGAKNIVIAIGGSSTNDGGAGLAAALGAQFYDSDGYNFIPTGGNLNRIDNIDFSGLDKRIRDTKVTVLCDVNNTICGENGATYMYAKQKGALDEELAFMDKGMLNYVSKIEAATSRNYLKLGSGGASGGLGLGCKVFLKADLVRGIDKVLEIIGFKRQILGSDLIISGEGKLDKQSLRGKAIFGVGRIAGDIPMYVVCGKNELTAEELELLHIKKVYVTNIDDLDMEEVQKNAVAMLQAAAQNIAKDILTM